jgi:hypothetical protein
MNLESIYAVLKAHLKTALELSALFLGIINGLMLLKFNWRDKPKLRVEPIHPEIYQWWFRFPDREVEGHQTRGYGFLAYVAIVNRGLRKVSLDRWRLFADGKYTKSHELKPYSMPEVTVQIGTHFKMLPQLGQRTLSFEGNTSVDSGDSISGTVYYVYECWGDPLWDPIIKDGKINGKFVIRDAFGNKTSCKIVFSERPLEEIEKLAEGIQHMR